MNPKKFHAPIFVASLFIAIFAYNMFVPNPDWFRFHYSVNGMCRGEYQFWGWFVGMFFGGMAYLGLYSLVCALLEKEP